MFILKIQMYCVIVQQGTQRGKLLMFSAEVYVGRTVARLIAFRFKKISFVSNMAFYRSGCGLNPQQVAQWFPTIFTAAHIAYSIMASQKVKCTKFM